MIKVTVDFRDGRKFNNLMRYLKNIDFVRAEAEVMNIANNAIENMKTTIDSSRKRPDKGTHKLENALGEPEEVLNDPGKELIIGIGRISTLKAEAPYWEVLDVGGYIPPANIGYFTSGSGLSGDKTFPESGITGQNWIHTGKGQGSFFMKPKSPIEGIDYIGKATRTIDQELKATIEKLGGHFLNGMTQAST